MPRLYIIVGVIGSGKSTYCKKFAQEHDTIIVNDDDIVSMLHGGDYKLYDKSLKLLYKSIENTAITSALALGRDVMVDRGLNVSKEGRKRFIALADSFDILTTAIAFPTEGPDVHAKRRFQHDSREHTYEYWLHVAKEQLKRFQYPTLDEGINHVYQVRNHNENTIRS